MSIYPSQHKSSSPVPATALLVDLRNFTPNLNLAPMDESGVNVFCTFLARFYARCLEACTIALPPESRDSSVYYVNTTGDGILAVFMNETHHLSGFLASVCLHNVLKRECSKYNSNYGGSQIPATSFGVGVESGHVSLVKARRSLTTSQDDMETYIGDCINVAARAEGISKIINKANTVVAENTNELCCRTLFETSYKSIVSLARSSETTDDKRLQLYDEATQLNRQLCLAFLESHLLKGVPKPIALFKLGDRSAQIGNPRLVSLIQKLTLKSKTHHDEVLKYLNESV